MIDFDELSKQWRMNKKTDKYNPGVFEYVCGVIKENGTPMMCTGYGGYSYEDSFRLMNKAINEYNIKESNIYVKGNYIFNNVSTEIQKDILQKQPKVYMNTELEEIIVRHFLK